MNLLTSDEAIYLIVVIFWSVVIIYTGIRGFSSWISTGEDTSIKSITLPFDRFKTFYEINPDRYSIFEDCVEARLNDGRVVEITFSLFDKKKYLKWYRNHQYELENEKERQEERIIMESYIKSVRADLNEFAKITSDSKITLNLYGSDALNGIPNTKHTE